MVKKIFLISFFLIYFIFKSSFSSEIQNGSLIFAPSAYLVDEGYTINTNNPTGMNVDFMLSYFPREEIDGLKGESVLLFGWYLKLQLLQETKILPSIGSGYFLTHTTQKLNGIFGDVKAGNIYFIASKNLHYLKLHSGIIYGRITNILNFDISEINKSSQVVYYGGASFNFKKDIWLKGEIYNPDYGSDIIYSSSLSIQYFSIGILGKNENVPIFFLSMRLPIVNYQ